MIMSRHPLSEDNSARQQVSTTCGSGWLISRLVQVNHPLPEVVLTENIKETR
jgi:hypothetical protein